MDEDALVAVMTKHSKLILRMYQELGNILRQQIGTLAPDTDAARSETIRLVLRTHIRIHYLAERQPLYNAFFDLGFPDREFMLTFLLSNFLLHFEHTWKEKL